MYFSGSKSPGLSPVQGAKEKVDEPAVRRRVSESGRRQLFSLLKGLEGCHIDRFEKTDELVQQVTRFLAVWPEMFPDQELERLREVL
jgi:hypothetical protein